MTRRHVTFDCEGAQLVGTIDEGDGPAGLLLVTGGNELRSGAWGGQSEFAARLAASGFPVFRFDRRGTGDSEGRNAGFRASAPDIAAALGAFRAQCPVLGRVVAMGNCDAASALMLAGGAGLDALILSNPWTFDEDGEAPAPQDVRRHYRGRLADAAAIKRLLTGKVSLGGLVRSLFAAARPASPPSSLVGEMNAGIARFPAPVVYLVAERDRTGQAFLSAWTEPGADIRLCPGATHSYVEPHARDWLFEQALRVLRG
ncbi:hydrolase 1, exosortase A system-associated [Novosphingobium sp. PC22D]|uniref:hydrolase 1, exosortase A system-associated n=1 Tax=Novosphingobium sp. PC22D TaxID=1962403 RepID=UPI000BF1EC6C|nr:hydrolase 1, exosortase A system-associated [Novosphingobium sp. PC22D]PEQ10639.1 hydrolase 1, exosortase A system-associated [Novosphingobium sp. PC22D]